VAAVWVLLYHSQSQLDTIGLLSIPVLPEFIQIGRLGVDLFFALPVSFWPTPTSALWVNDSKLKSH